MYIQNLFISLQHVCLVPIHQETIHLNLDDLCPTKSSFTQFSIPTSLRAVRHLFSCCFVASYLLLLLPLSLLFVTMPWQQHFCHGSANAFLFTVADTRNSNGGASKQSCPLDKSTKTSPYVCFACGFKALDDPAL